MILRLLSGAPPDSLAGTRFAVDDGPEVGTVCRAWADGSDVLGEVEFDDPGVAARLVIGRTRSGVSLLDPVSPHPHQRKNACTDRRTSG